MYRKGWHPRSKEVISEGRGYLKVFGPCQEGARATDPSAGGATGGIRVPGWVRRPNIQAAPRLGRGGLGSNVHRPKGSIGGRIRQ
eukprot:9959112-Heterocapsa_arctica.AAC.1